MQIVGDNLRICKKRKRLTNIESLPDDVLCEVLVHLQAQHIYDSVRLVCSKLYHLIHTHAFIYAHLQHSTYGLLFQSIFGDSLFMSVGESGRVEISQNRFNKLRCPVRTSCNGLVLESQESAPNKKLYVSNPVTRQIFSLPPIAGCKLPYELFAIGYAAASMEYKAVILFTPAGLMRKICFILTIGVDNSWRTIGKKSVLLVATETFVNAPLITEGFVHFYHTASNEVLTLNMETEIIAETSGPMPIGKRFQLNTYLSTGRYLSLLRPCGEFGWEVWEMKPKIDYQWRKVWDISLEAHKTTFQRLGFQQYEFLIPIGWLKYLEVLIFRTTLRSLRSEIFVYNFPKHEIVTIKLPVPNCDYDPIVHKDSLVSLRGC